MSKYTRIWMLFCAAIGIAGGLVYAQAHRRVLIVEPPAMKFGSVPVGTIVTRTVQLSNRSRSPVRITRIVVSCGCTTADAPNVIPPGRSVPMRISFNSTAKYGDIAKEVYVFTSSAKDPLTIPILGRTYSDIAAAPRMLDFGSVPVGAARTKSLVLTRFDHRPLNIERVHAPPGFRTSVGRPENGAPVVAVTYAAGHEAHDLSGEILFVTDDHAMPRFQVSVSGRVVGTYIVKPDVVDFGAVTSVGINRRQVTVSGPMVDTLRVVAVPHGTTVKLTHTSPTSAVLDVAYRPQSGPGTVVNDRIHMATRDPNEPSLQLPVLAAVE